MVSDFRLTLENLREKAMYNGEPDEFTIKLDLYHVETDEEIEERVAAEKQEAKKQNELKQIEELKKLAAKYKFKVVYDTDT